MGPYRTPPQRPPLDQDRGDDRMVYGLLLVIGLIRVMLALSAGQEFRAEATIACLLAAAGLIGLLR